MRKVAGNFTGILAIIGAIAAIFTLYGFFTRNAPVVHAELRSTFSFTPENVKVYFTPQEEVIWNLVSNDGIKHYCNSRTSDGRTNFFKNDENCVSAKSLAQKVNVSASYGDKDLARSTIDLKNTGTDVATSLKIRLSENGRINIADQAGKKLVDKAVASGDNISLPDLNPSESLKITIDSVQSLSSITDRPTPIITYAKGHVSISQYRVVSPFYANMADLFNDLPLILFVPIVIVASFLVTFSTILLVAVANALIKGRPVASVFSN